MFLAKKIGGVLNMAGQRCKDGQDDEATRFPKAIEGEAGAFRPKGFAAADAGTEMIRNDRIYVTSGIYLLLLFLLVST